MHHVSEHFQFHRIGQQRIFSKELLKTRMELTLELQLLRLVFGIKLVFPYSLEKCAPIESIWLTPVSLKVEGLVFWRLQTRMLKLLLTYSPLK